MYILSSINLILSGASPYNKYFFIKLLYHYGLDSPIDNGVKNISKTLGLTDRIVSRGLKFLCESGYLRQEFISSGRGRAGSQYYIEDRWIADLKNIDQDCAYSLPINLIENILRHDYSTKIGKGLHPLNVSSRLLIVVLLFNASVTGVVQHLSLAKLSKLTGLKNDALLKQVKILTKHGYIRKYIPGFTARYLFGRAKGMFFLNLRHANFGEQALAGMTFAYLSKDQRREVNKTETEMLFDMTKILNKVPQFITPYPHPVRPYTNSSGFSFRTEKLFDGIQNFFLLTPNNGAKQYFEIMLQDTASFLLSNCWDELPKDRIDYLLSNPTFELIIQQQFIPPALFEHIEGRFPSQDQKRQLGQVIYQMAFNMAHSMKSLLISQFPDLPLDQMYYQILPTSTEAITLYGAATFVLEAFYKAPVEGDAIVYLIIEEGKKFEPKVSRCKEIDFDMNDKYFFGLLSRTPESEQPWIIPPNPNSLTDNTNNNESA